MATVAIVNTTVVAFEDMWNATSQRTIDGEDIITVEQEYTYTDGKSESFTRTVTIDEFSKEYASPVESNPRLLEDIKNVASGRYEGTMIDFSSTLRGQFFGGVTESTNGRGVRIKIGQEYYDPSGGIVRVVGNFYKAGQTVYMAKRADSPSWINIDLLRSDPQQPLTDIEYPTKLANVLAKGERYIDIYIYNENGRISAESYVKENSKGFKDADIRIIVIGDSQKMPRTGTKANGRLAIVYHFDPQPDGGGQKKS